MKYLKLFEQFDWENDPFGEEIWREPEDYTERYYIFKDKMFPDVRFLKTIGKHVYIFRGRHFAEAANLEYYKHIVIPITEKQIKRIKDDKIEISINGGNRMPLSKILDLIHFGDKELIFLDEKNIKKYFK